MESIYYVMCWACHRKCKHCYEDRFRPYLRADLEKVVAEAERNAPRIIANFPDRLTYLDPEDPNPDGSFKEKIGRVILSGGESLIDPVRERVTYRAIELLTEKYRAQGGVNIVLQTTGDVLTGPILDDLLARGVTMISIASTDRFHVGIDTPEKQQAFLAELTALFDSRGVKRAGLASAANRRWHDDEGPVWNAFGASEDTWIGKIWPRGRGWTNGLSTATLADNFCNRWSGGLGFLNHRFAGSEVSVEPDGAVYPCCIKTTVPIGNLNEEGLIGILDSLVGDPSFEAIAMGHPERMGVTRGWSPETFLAKSKTTTPKGAPYQNLCIGCDAFHRDVLKPVIEEIRARRLGRAQVAAE
ncbi:MAG: radical SAM/SPASM domain-containing protein [Alphaproteobacteria bacterium]